MKALSNRLQAVADMVRQNAVIADIGTDHGYIPVWLIKAGIISSAVAADINEGPLASCRRFVEQQGLCDAVSVRLSDGLAALDPEEYDTIIIAGMGGELIADILSRETAIRDKHIILNPMTHPEIARKFLYDNGFEIDRDIIVSDFKHHYSVFDAHYTGNVKKRTAKDYFLGNIKDFSDKAYFNHLLNYLKNKAKSGGDFTEIIGEIEALL